MSVGNVRENEMSYELYREIAEELCVPVDERLAPDVRYELYNSKLVYLKHLRNHCFWSINRTPQTTPFAPDDLALIQKALELTHDFQRQAILEALHLSLAKARRRDPRDSSPARPA